MNSWTQVNSPQPSSAFTRLIHNWPVLVAALCGVLITIASYLAFQWQEQRRVASHAQLNASMYARMLREGMQSYVRLNVDTAGLFSASENVTLHEFVSYIDSIHARKTHPGLSYVGYLPRVAANRIPQFEAGTRKTIPSYSIHSNQRNADAVFPMLYAAPFDETAKRFLGFDYAMISERREAMQRAADLGESIATRKLAYLSSSSPEDHVFIFTPIYDASGPDESIGQGRAALSGYVFSVFMLENVIDAVMGPGFKQQFDLEIYDGAPSRQNLLV